MSRGLTPYRDRTPLPAPVADEASCHVCGQLVPLDGVLYGGRQVRVWLGAHIAGGVVCRGTGRPPR